MEYQKIINLLDNTPNQPTKFREKYWVKINDEERGTYNTNTQIKFKTSMLKSSLCDYSNVCILVSATITVAALVAGGGNNDIQVVFKNCAPFTNCMSEINNTQIDNAKYIDVVMPMYDLIEYSNNYSKTSGSLWQYYSNESHLNDAGAASFKFKLKITVLTEYDGTKIAKIMVPLKFLSNSWRPLEMLLINCETNLILAWSANCVISNAAANQATPFCKN